MKKFPKISHYRQFIKNMKYLFPDKETFELVGYPKLHGSNASVRLKNGEIVCFSRRMGLSAKNTNSGFFNFVDERKDWFKNNLKEDSIVYGEWCGKGIQKGVAINELEKCFVVFALWEDGDWVDPKTFADNSDLQIYNIRKCCEPHILSININEAHLVVDEVNSKVEEYENCCPFGKYRGVSGIGEGLVYVYKNNFEFAFKAKGDKHSESKIKKMPSAVDIEKVKNVQEFVDRHAHEERLQQAWDIISEEHGEIISMKLMGDFIRWMNNDIWDEESDEAEENNIERKDFGKYLSPVCVQWFKQKVYV